MTHHGMESCVWECIQHGNRGDTYLCCSCHAALDEESCAELCKDPQSQTSHMVICGMLHVNPQVSDPGSMFFGCCASFAMRCILYLLILWVLLFAMD